MTITISADVNNITKQALRIIHSPKSSLYISSTFRGMTFDGRYIHLTKNGRVTYHPDYYTIDGRLLQPHL